MAERGLGHDVQRTVVDRRAAVDGVGGGLAHEAPVGMGGAGDLPQPEGLGVRLTGARGPQHADHVVLGLQDEDRGLAVGAQDRRSAPERGGDVRGLARRRDGQAAGSPAVHEEPVEDLGRRVEAVDVGDQRHRRLRLADGHEVLHRHAVEGGDPGPHGPAHLAVDVVGEGVARVLEVAVPGRVEGPQPDACRVRALDVGDPHPHVAAFDAERLRGDADPGVALSRDLLVQRGPVGVGVDPAADVHPLGTTTRVR